MSSPELFDFYPFPICIPVLMSWLDQLSISIPIPVFILAAWLVWLSEGLKHSLPRHADSIDKQSGEKVMRGQFNTYRV